MTEKRSENSPSGITSLRTREELQEQILGELSGAVERLFYSEFAIFQNRNIARELIRTTEAGFLILSARPGWLDDDDQDFPRSRCSVQGFIDKKLMRYLEAAGRRHGYAIAVGTKKSITDYDARGITTMTQIRASDGLEVGAAWAPVGRMPRRWEGLERDKRDGGGERHEP